MFFGRLLATAQACALPGRSFSTTACLGKMKTHQGAKKRWTSLPSGKFKRAHAFHQHLNTNKTPAQKNRLGKTAYSTHTQTVKLKKAILPYGTH
ncbi:uncharacterized protein SCHCODRAFT_02615905 [Schizophyllum commune H4-8]|nr:uncharacterized protein SCHCODRAFT_02615905 [Schizophyllum commune H4-8]KAI5896814.1 hypothetical protein SCHCODRAFT_02615905 [Schizophyllum commune H4-8]